MKLLIYLASPYSHDDPDVRQDRFNAVCLKAAELMLKGYFVFSPIAHTHPIALASDLPKGFDYWQEYNEKMIGLCDKVFVYRLDGWEESEGIAGEIEYAKELGKEVRYLDGKETN